MGSHQEEIHFDNSNYHSHKKQYVVIFFVLGILTAIEIAIPEFSMPYLVHASSLTALALIKAFLVAYYYMHLKEETKWLKWITLIPVSAVIYAAVVTIESIAR